MVPVHARRLPSSGKADMPGVEDIMRDMSSLCSLDVFDKHLCQRNLRISRFRVFCLLYRLVTFPSLPDLELVVTVLLGSGRSAAAPVVASLRIGSMILLPLAPIFNRVGCFWDIL